jgi:hypothetical protein
MSLKSKFAIAWSLALAPILLFIPAFALAGMGPCTFSHPLVIVGAFLVFIALEIAALPRFVRAARASGKVIGAMMGMGLALFLLVLCTVLEYYVVAEYWADSQFGLM